MSRAVNITNNGNIDIGNTGVSADTNIIRIGTSQTATYIAGVLLPPPPVLIQTNFIDGQRYTNSYGWPLTIGATIVLNSASVAGSANESFCIQASPAVGGFTNVCAISTIVGKFRAPLHQSHLRVCADQRDLLVHQLEHRRGKLRLRQRRATEISMKNLFIILLMFIATGASAQQYSIGWYKIAGGGGTSTGGSIP